MDSPWMVEAVWVDRGGSETVRRFRFASYADCRREVVRLFCQLGDVSYDDRALRRIEVAGDFWADRPLAETRTGTDTRH